MTGMIWQNGRRFLRMRRRKIKNMRRSSKSWERRSILLGRKNYTMSFLPWMKRLGEKKKQSKWNSFCSKSWQTSSASWKRSASSIIVRPSLSLPSSIPKILSSRDRQSAKQHPLSWNEPSLFKMTRKECGPSKNCTSQNRSYIDLII